MLKSKFKRYHKWMQNKELQELTASEPLTLDEEYKMQKSWRNDNDKCTFLIMDKELYENTSNEIESLIGDTNLFLQQTDNYNECIIIAEAEIMIAELMARGKRFGWESMLLMFNYGIDNLNINKFIAKINWTNSKCIEMFKKMNFIEISKSNVFQEFTFERIVNSEWLNWLHSNIEFHILRLRGNDSDDDDDDGDNDNNNNKQRFQINTN